VWEFNWGWAVVVKNVKAGDLAEWDINCQRVGNRQKKEGGAPQLGKRLRDDHLRRLEGDSRHPNEGKGDWGVRRTGRYSPRACADDFYAGRLRNEQRLRKVTCRGERFSRWCQNSKREAK